jgi:nucleotide-binding universal stress UspA family protein
MQAARLIRRPGMVVLISDLLVEAAAVAEAVKLLRAVGHHVTVLHIMDPAERDLSIGGEAVFADPESGLEVTATVADVRAAYRKTVEEAIAEWRETLQSTGAGYEVFTTDEPFGVPLRKAFAARQRLP